MKTFIKYIYHTFFTKNYKHFLIPINEKKFKNLQPTTQSLVIVNSNYK